MVASAPLIGHFSSCISWHHLLHLLLAFDGLCVPDVPILAPVLKLEGTVIGVTHLPVLHQPSTMVCVQWTVPHKGIAGVAGYVGD